MSAYRLLIRGKVQGVFYRESAKREALRLGVRGWIRNLEDSSVEAIVEGTDEQIQSFIAWAKQGPPLAQVREVLVSEVAESGFQTFEVRR